MVCVEKRSDDVVFTVNNRDISIGKDLVNKYSDIVCPVSEQFLKGMINVLGKDCSDETLSRRIELDMTQELDEYGQRSVKM